MPFDSMPKPDVLSLEGLIAWLETQDPATEYDFWNCETCLLASYLKSVGSQVRKDYLPIVRHTAGQIEGEHIDVSLDLPWTYGAALTRARALTQGK